VPDAQDYEGDAYGIDRLIDVMNGYREAAPQELIERVLDSVMEYSKDVDQFDDITMLAFKYLGSGDGSELKLEARLENTRKVIGFVMECLEDRGCEKAKAGKIALAVEELFVNIANYAYPDGEGMAYIRVDYPDDSSLRIELIDDGIPYDPSSKEDPDITVPLKKRGIGGMGIFMAKNIMDEMKYERRDGQNHLTLIKKLKGGNEVG
jgi:sigma-B regulation protein RsbU (phosphoserine phosphatase)